MPFLSHIASLRNAQLSRLSTTDIMTSQTSQTSSHPQIPHHIPGIPQTYATPSPTNKPYHAYNTPPKSPPSPSHHRNSSSSQSDSHTYTQQIALLQETVNHLQLIDTSRAEAITEQKIQLAVSKNDLLHAREKIADKEAVISSLGSVIGSLTRGASAPSNPSSQVSTCENIESGKKRISELEKEIERFRKSDRQLRARIRYLERGVDARGSDDDIPELMDERGMPVYENGSFEKERRIQASDIGWGVLEQTWKVHKGKGKIVERDVGLGLGSVNLPECQQEYRRTVKPGQNASQPGGSWGRKNAQQKQHDTLAPSESALDKEKVNNADHAVNSARISANLPPHQQTPRYTTPPRPSPFQHIGNWGEPPKTCASTEIPTIPNTPIESPSFDLSNIDIGVCSLEDFFDNDGYPPLSFPPPISGKPGAEHTSLLSLLSPTAASNSFPAAMTAESSSASSTIRAIQAQHQIQHQPQTPQIQDDETQPPAPRIEEDPRPIDEQVSSNQQAMAYFQSMPTPGTIKTGFILEGTFRGADYSRPIPIPSRATGEFDRFTPRNGNSNFNHPSSPRGFNRSPPTGPRPQQECPYPLDLNLWINAQDRNGAIEAHMIKSNGRGDTRFPDIFRYGIQFVPSAQDAGYFRTVMLSNLPLDTTALDILHRVRGGEVLSCTVVSMKGIVQGTVSARVVFKQEAAAGGYVSYTDQHPIRFEDGMKADVALVETPTYPSSFRTQSRLDSQTRCLTIPNIPHNFSIDALEHNLACGNAFRAQGLLEMYIDSSFTLHLQFSSVELASSAFNILMTRHGYRDLKCVFEADPCAGPVAELAVEVHSRFMLFPENWAENTIGKSLVGGSASSESDVGNEGGEEREGGGRKPLAALGKRNVVIPDLAKVELKSASWADEVNEWEDEGFTKVVLMKRYVGESESEGSGTRSGEKRSGGLTISRGATFDRSSEDAAADGEVALKGKSSKENSWVDLDTTQVNSRSEHPTTSTSSTSQATTIEVNTTLKVLTIDQELQAALLTSNTTKNLTTSISTALSTSIPASTSTPITTTSSLTPDISSQNPLTGLAASKYANPTPTPSIINTKNDRQPRSTNRNVSSVAFTFPSKSPSADLEAAAGQEVQAIYPPRLSNSPPRVNLDDLIASNRSSFASRSARSGSGEAQKDENQIVEAKDESEAEVEGIVEEEQIEGEQIEEILTKPKVQLFSWAKIPRAGSGGGKKRDFSASEEMGIDLHGTSSASATAGTVERGEIESEKVINFDEINLDDDDDDEVNSVEGEKATMTEAISGPEMCPSQEVTVKIENETNTENENKISNLSTNLSNKPKLNTIPETENEDLNPADITSIAKKAEGCCSAYKHCKTSKKISR